MVRRILLIVSLVSASLLILAGLVYAQDSGPQSIATLQGVDAPQAVMGTAFTYQGQLKRGGSNVTTSCQMAFRLYDAASTGNPIGSPITQTVAITDGLFTVGLDFGSGAFNGEARWLQIAVRCPLEITFTTLSRQALTAAPYALALPGLRTEPNATGPNVIGGYSGNTVTATAGGATIGGGGSFNYAPHRITDDFGTIGGGVGNRAGDDDDSSMNASSATVGGGAYNTAGNYNATVAGGSSNTASGERASVGGGGHNEATGNAATVGGGSSNTASGTVSTVPGGQGAVADHYAQLAYSSSHFTTYGDSQMSLFVLRRSATMAAGNWYDLYIVGTQLITITSTKTLTFDILLAGRTEAGESAGYRIQGVIENYNGTTSFIGTPTIIALGEDDAAWDARVVADDANDALGIQVRGNGEIIRWVATVYTSEVAW